jgi:TM2 domain-containing membrane protein YozV/cold shock CspA family protein
MRGRVLGYDYETGEGVISGDDGNRYTVQRSGLGSGVRTLVPGKAVDFVVQDGAATGVYPIAGGMDEKNKWVAAILAFFLGGFGVHKFYLGKNTAGLIMLGVFLAGIIFLGVPSLIIGIIAFIEAIIYVIKSDEEFHEDYIAGERSWF